jgi:ABC-type cobalt transport system substrate-binding protein
MLLLLLLLLIVILILILPVQPACVNELSAWISADERSVSQVSRCFLVSFVPNGA